MRTSSETQWALFPFRVAIATALALALAGCTRETGPGGGPPGPDGGGGGDPGGGASGGVAVPTLEAPEGTQCTLLPGTDQPQGWGMGTPIMIRGTFQQPEGQEISAGMLLLELVQPGAAGNVVYHFLCGDRTTFEVGLPAEMGEVVFVAFLDVAGDGPVGQDPRGRSPEAVKVGIEDVEGITIPLTVGGDLGDLSSLFPTEEVDEGGEKPPHPTGDGAPGEGEPPPQGQGGAQPPPGDGETAPTGEPGPAPPAGGDSAPAPEAAAPPPAAE